jgi:hypothetical protein
MSADASVELLRAQLQRCLAPAVWHGFTEQLAELERGAGLDAWLTIFSATARRLGRAPFGADALMLPGPHGPSALTDWSVDVAARALLLLLLATRPDSQFEQATWTAYRDGDTLEKLAVVRTLPLLPGQTRFLELALDAGRTNDARLFRALACDNPFAAAHYPELEWNKLFMKAAFVGAPLERMLGRAQRENPELARMALEYIEEQESAGRGFPAEIWLAVAAFPGAGAVAKLLGYASHANPMQRLAAVRGLLRVRQARTASFLRERLDVEPDAAVRAALDEALAALHAEHAEDGAKQRSSS